MQGQATSPVLDLNCHIRLKALQEAQAKLQQGRHAEAVPLLENLLEMYPEQPQNIPHLCNEKAQLLVSLAHFTFMTRKEDPLAPPRVLQFAMAAMRTAKWAKEGGLPLST